ncbi:MAG TPA: TIGR01906 family membrane protein [Anaerolineales bacterium]|nr:TIGR01906 family membrane protein [Anaerolineales bacterium]
MTLPTPLQSILSWLVTIFLPFALILTAVRLLFTPLFLEIEYRTPNFPNDSYGFTLEDRLKWSKVSMAYLLSNDTIDFFEPQRFEDGTRIYNDRELSHMTDVKVVVDWTMRVWLLALIVVIGVGIWAWLGGWLDPYKIALTRGAWITIGFVGVVVLFVVAAFGVFFVFFHNVFFAPGTWTFLYSDTFIRLFPQRFWQDTFLWVGGLAVVQAALILWVVGKR